jgi:hypothetical protein
MLFPVREYIDYDDDYDEDDEGNNDDNINVIIFKALEDRCFPPIKGMNYHLIVKVEFSINGRRFDRESAKKNLMSNYSIQDLMIFQPQKYRMKINPYKFDIVNISNSCFFIDILCYYFSVEIFSTKEIIDRANKNLDKFLVFNHRYLRTVKINKCSVVSFS